MLRSENGAIGEARTKALLLDRFWVSERSVDIEGADFLIQRQSSRHTLDRHPPRLGIVQAKFIQDENTTIYIHPHHLMEDDRQKQVRKAYFLLVHTGLEDSQEVYFLTAAQIVDNFPVVAAGKKHHGKFRISGSEVAVEKYKSSKKKILETIHHVLAEADLPSSASMYAYLFPERSRAEEVVAVHPLNTSGAFANEAGYLAHVNETKRRAKKLLDEVSSMKDCLSDICTSMDPMAVVYAARHFDAIDADFKSTRSALAHRDTEDEMLRIAFAFYLKSHGLEAAWHRFLADVRLQIDTSIDASASAWKLCFSHAKDFAAPQLELASLAADAYTNDRHPGYKLAEGYFEISFKARDRRIRTTTRPDLVDSIVDIIAYAMAKCIVGHEKNYYE